MVVQIATRLPTTSFVLPEMVFNIFAQQQCYFAKGVEPEPSHPTTDDVNFGRNVNIDQF